MDNLEIIREAFDHVLKRYSLDQGPVDGSKVIINSYLFAEQVQTYIENNKHKHVSREKHFPMLQMMKKEGGDFVRALSAAMFYANTEDYAKLCDMFPEYVSDYKQRAKENV